MTHEEIRIACESEFKKANYLYSQAREYIHPKYHAYLIKYPRRKRIGKGPNGNWEYADTFKPYVTVDGRIQMAKDDHEQKGEPYSCHTEFKQVGDQLICTVTASSPFYGTHTSTVGVVARTGVDRMIEAAESSALARALRFMGYGIIPGIDDDELTELIESGVTTPHESMFAGTEEEEQNIAEMLDHLGWGETQIRKRLSRLTTTPLVESFISQCQLKIQEQLDEEEKASEAAPKAVRTPGIWDDLFNKVAEFGVSDDDFANYIRQEYETRDIETLGESVVQRFERILTGDEGTRNKLLQDIEAKTEQRSLIG